MQKIQKYNELVLWICKFCIIHTSRSRSRHDFYRGVYKLCFRSWKRSQSWHQWQHASILWTIPRILFWCILRHLWGRGFSCEPFARRCIQWWAWRITCIRFSCRRILFRRRWGCWVGSSLWECLLGSPFIILIFCLLTFLFGRVLPFCTRNFIYLCNLKFCLPYFYFDDSSKLYKL